MTVSPGLQGLAVMSSALEVMYACLMNNQVRYMGRPAAGGTRSPRTDVTAQSVLCCTCLPLYTACPPPAPCPLVLPQLCCCQQAFETWQIT